jgi:hypothetical protein
MNSLHRYNPSAVACSSARLDPSGSEIWHSIERDSRQQHCVLCGSKMHEGDVCEPAKSGFTKTFMNWWKGYTGDVNGVLCGHCTTMLSNSSIFLAKNAMVTPTRSWAMNSDAQRAWCLLNLPQDEPYLMSVCNAKSQHLLWRCPVNLPSGVEASAGLDSVVFLRYGEKIGALRMRVLRDAVACSNSLNRRFRKEKDIAKGMLCPIKIDREFKDCHCGEWRSWVDGLLVPRDRNKEPQIYPNDSDLTYLKTLTPAEAWALNILIKHQDAGALEEPPTAFSF